MLNYFALNKEIKIYRKDTKGKEKCSRKEQIKLFKDEEAGKETWKYTLKDSLVFCEERLEVIRLELHKSHSIKVNAHIFTKF